MVSSAPVYHGHANVRQIACSTKINIGMYKGFTNGRPLERFYHLFARYVAPAASRRFREPSDRNIPDRSSLTQSLHPVCPPWYRPATLLASRLALSTATYRRLRKFYSHTRRAIACLVTRCLRGPRGNIALGKGSMDRSRRTSISRGVRPEQLSLPVWKL